MLFLPEQLLVPDSREDTFQRLPLISLFGAVLPTDEFRVVVKGYNTNSIMKDF